MVSFKSHTSTAEQVEDMHVIVKNTFIDDVESDDDEQYAGKRFSHIKSLPAWCLRTRMSLLDELESVETCSTGCSTACCSDDEVSNADMCHTPCSQSFHEEQPSSPVDLDNLVSIIMKECSFLRVASYDVKVGPLRKRGKDGVPLAMLRLFVNDLPWAQRARWEQTLNWSVQSILQSTGNNAAVKCNELRVYFEGEGFVVLSFSAPVA